MSAPNINSMSDDPGPDPQSPSIVALVTAPGVDAAALASWLTAADVPLFGTNDISSAAQSDDVLAACQSAWWAPPEYRPGWMNDSAVVTLAEHLVRELHAFPSNAVWLNRDHGLLLDLWRTNGAAIGSAVLLWGAPEDAVTALACQGIKRHHALALWEHNVRHALGALAGCRTYVCAQGELDQHFPELGAFLESSGVSISALPTLGLGQSDEEPTERAALVEILKSVSGSHDEFPKVSLPSPSASGEELLSAHRSVYRIGVEAKEAWLLADQHARALSRLEADMTQTMAGVNQMVEHLLDTV